MHNAKRTQSSGQTALHQRAGPATSGRIEPPPGYPSSGNAYGGRASTTRIEWLEEAAGISCDHPTNSANLLYRRCFSPPFIEDVAGERMERDLEVAIAVAVL